MWFRQLSDGKLVDISPEYADPSKFVQASPEEQALLATGIAKDCLPARPDPSRDDAFDAEAERQIAEALRLEAETAQPFVDIVLSEDPYGEFDALAQGLRDLKANVGDTVRLRLVKS